jgi:hypothetical protein
MIVASVATPTKRSAGKVMSADRPLPAAVPATCVPGRLRLVADDRERIRRLQCGVDRVGVVFHAPGEAGRARLALPRRERLVPDERDACGAVGIHEVVEREVESEVDDPDDRALAGQGGLLWRRDVKLVGSGLRDGCNEQRCEQPRGLDELHLWLGGQCIELGDRELDSVYPIRDRRPRRVPRCVRGH